MALHHIPARWPRLALAAYRDDLHHVRIGIDRGGSRADGYAWWGVQLGTAFLLITATWE